MFSVSRHVPLTPQELEEALAKLIKQHGHQHEGAMHLPVYNRILSAQMPDQDDGK